MSLAGSKTPRERGGQSLVCQEDGGLFPGLEGKMAFWGHRKPRQVAFSFFLSSLSFPPRFYLFEREKE